MKYRSIVFDVARVIEEVEKRGWNVSDLADRIGWERQQLYRLLKYGRARKITIEMIAQGLELPVTELITDETAQLPVMLDQGAVMPTRAHDTDAGLDLYAMEGGVIPACGSASFDTGVHCAIPKGYVGLLTSKSGLMSNDEITSRGTIDADYRGSIQAILFNHSHKPVRIETGQKITQMVILPIITPEPVLADKLEATARGSQGFGSTGKF